MTLEPLTFVIVEKDAFVALDMQLGLQDASVGCQVVHLRDIADFQSMPQPADRPVIITKLSIAEIDECGLVQIAGRRAAIVVREGIDSVKAVVDRGWLSLASPFTADDLLTLVEDIRQVFALIGMNRPGA